MKQRRKQQAKRSGMGATSQLMLMASSDVSDDNESAVNGVCVAFAPLCLGQRTLSLVPSLSSVLFDSNHRNNLEIFSPRNENAKTKPSKIGTLTPDGQIRQVVSRSCCFTSADIRHSGYQRVCCMSSF
jgi:hypothetical protein